MFKLFPFLLVAVFSFVYITAQSQAPCDSIVLHTVSFDPLNSQTKVQVLVENQSTWLFDYPKFILRDAQDDTVASEYVNFFGLGNYIQAHTLKLEPGLASTTVAGGKLQLYSISDTLLCEWENDYELCVDSCIDLVVIMQGGSFPSAYHRYTYAITDSNNTVVLSDTLVLDSANYTDWDSICLPIGAYHVDFVEDVSSATEAVYARVDPFHNTSGPVVNGQGDLSFDLDVFTMCLHPLDTIDDPLGLPAQQRADLIIHQSNKVIHVSGIQDFSSTLNLYDINGRLLNTTRANVSTASIDAVGFAAGTYVLEICSGTQIHSQKFILVD